MIADLNNQIASLEAEVSRLTGENQELTANNTQLTSEKQVSGAKSYRLLLLKKKNWLKQLM